jgi:hypothetical protein
MKYLRLFENFELGREEIIDFFEDLELVDIKSINVVKVKDFIKIPIPSAPADRYCHNLFANYNNYKEYESSRKISEYLSYFSTNLLIDKGLVEKEIMIVDMDFNHPKMIRNSSFQYENYIKEVIKSRVQRIHDGYDMDVFLHMPSIINWTSDPIASLKMYIIPQIDL